jgi:hypothetical protein
MLEQCGIAQRCNRFLDDGHIDGNGFHTYWSASSFKPHKDLASRISIGDITKPTPGTVEPARHPGKRKAAAMADYMFALHRG